MARINLSAEVLQSVAAAIDAAGGELPEDHNIHGVSIGRDTDDLTPTDTTVAEWIEARGEPTQRHGNVLVWDETHSSHSATKPGRTFHTTTTVFVMPVDGGTVALVRR